MTLMSVIKLNMIRKKRITRKFPAGYFYCFFTISKKSSTLLYKNNISGERREEF